MLDCLDDVLFPFKYEKNMSLISQLDKLCSVFLNHLPETFTFGRTKEKTFLLKRKLKRIAYDSLFEGAPRSKWKTLASLDGGTECVLHLGTQVLMKCFDMRVNSQTYKAERLEVLTENLEHLTESSEALLTFLLSLADTGKDRLYSDNHSIKPKSSSKICRGTAEEFPIYSPALFSRLNLEDAQQSRPDFETSLQNEIERNLRVCTASPGSGLLGVRLFRQNNVDSYDRLTQFSLFGALLHTRTSDMDIKLNLPPIPDNADCMGLTIKVPSPNDQSDDEGFQSAPNMTPDSIVEPFNVAGTSIWEAALHHTPSNYRTWESIGSMPVPTEKPFVTEAGRDVFDRLCSLREKEAMQLVGTVQNKWEFVQQHQLVEYSLNVLNGISSHTFPFSQNMQIFTVQKGIRMSGLSSETVFGLLSMLAAHGSSYWRLSAFLALASSHSRCERGLVFQAFVSGIRKYLLYYKACVLSVSPMTTSLLALTFLFHNLGSQLRYLADLCKVGLDNTKEDLKDLPLGVNLLSYLYQEALGRCEGENYHVLLSLLRSSCEPFTRYIHEWVYEGICKDVYGEFMIEVNYDYLNCKDKRYWTHGYVLQSHTEELPFFLDSLMHDMYSCGKSINLLKRCNPRHYICWTEIPLPPITVKFSSKDIMAIEKECELYSRRMQSVASSSSESREEKELEAEIAKHNLMTLAQDKAEMAMEMCRERRLAVLREEDAKKREIYNNIKEQYDKDMERRREVSLREKIEDLAWAFEAKRQDEMLKAKARQELVDLHNGLLPEAEHKKPSTLCKVHRPRLENENEQQTLEKQQMHQGSVTSQDLTRNTLKLGSCGSKLQESSFSEEPQDFDTKVAVSSVAKLDANGETAYSSLSNRATGLFDSSQKQSQQHTSLDDHETYMMSALTNKETISDAVFLRCEEEATPDGPQNLLHISQSLICGDVSPGFHDKLEHTEPLSTDNDHVSVGHIQRDGYVSNTETCCPRIIVQGYVPETSMKEHKESGGNLSVTAERDGVVTRPGSSSMDLLDLTEVQLIPQQKLTAKHKHVSDSVIQDILYPQHKDNVCDADVPKTHYQAEYCTAKPEDSPVEPALDSQVVEVDLRLKVCSVNDEQRKVPADKETKPCKEVLLANEQSVLVGEQPSPSSTVQQQSAESFYDVEQYQDSFGVMSEPPRPLFLMGTKASWEIPDGAVQASEMISLPILMQRSLLPPIRTQVNIVNKAVLDFFFVDLNIEKHFETLQHFLLLEDGEFAQSLSDQLFDKMGEGLGPREMLNPLVLNAVLARALQYSLHGDGTIADHLSFALKSFPETFKPNDPMALSCVELKYKVPWPANIVITESCIGKYNRLFSFMLQLKRMVWTLKDVWFHLQHSDLVDHAATSAEFRGLHLFRQEMQHFVRVIQEYIVTQILHVTWSEFRQRLGAISNLDDLCRAYSEYLNNAIFRALLTDKAAPVMNVILGIFKVILKFRNELVSHQWDLGQQGSISHPNFRALQESFEAFKNYSNFLYKVVVKLVQRGYQPHLEDFLLRLNFNSYYCADKVLTT
uniref:gamma-tubulin complex component 6 isoform X2 n=1 Tax=Myxine glutinosa TaxID=7769 RepID=UPI00358EF79D